MKINELITYIKTNKKCITTSVVNICVLRHILLYQACFEAVASLRTEGEEEKRD